MHVLFGYLFCLSDHIFPSPNKPNAKCARGARSPDAPTVPF